MDLAVNNKNEIILKNTTLCGLQDWLAIPHAVG